MRTTILSEESILKLFYLEVYSGDITQAEKLTYYEEASAQPRLFDENAPAYGSVVYVEL